MQPTNSVYTSGISSPGGPRFGSVINRASTGSVDASNVEKSQQLRDDQIVDLVRQANAESAASAKAAMEFESREADKAREFNYEYLRNGYSAMVEGLQKAGLNPILAYSQGLGSASGNSAASGQSYRAQSPYLDNSSVALDLFKALLSAYVSRQNTAENNETKVRMQETDLIYRFLSSLQ